MESMGSKVISGTVDNRKQRTQQKIKIQLPHLHMGVQGRKDTILDKEEKE